MSFDGSKDVLVRANVSGTNVIDIPILTSLQKTVAFDVSIKGTIQGENEKNIPLKVNVAPYRVDYGLYGVSQWETAPRHTFFFAQGGSPDKSVAATDPYWYIKSGTSETGAEGFFESGIGQNDALDRSDAQLRSFMRVAQDDNEGWVKIKPSLWFHPSGEPTTPQTGMLYYDSSTNVLKFYDGSSWKTVADAAGAMTAHEMTGSYHTASGLSVGQVVRATGASTFAWAQLGHGDLGSVTSDQHHPQNHALIDTTGHIASGLTSGHFLKATGTTTYAFQAHGLTASDVGAVDSTTYSTHAHGIGDPTQVSYLDLTNVPSTFAPSTHDIVGSAHSASGLTAGHVIRASGATTFAWGPLQHPDLDLVTSDQHHAQIHAASHAVGSGDALSVGVPVNIGTSNTEGSATNFARRDHVHNHPSGLGANLHHDAASVHGAPLTISTQQIRFNYGANYFRLSGNDLLVGTDVPATDEVLTWDGTNAVWAAGASGGGDISGSGNANKVAKFTAAKTIGDSTITCDGSDVSTSGHLTVSGGNIYWNNTWPTNWSDPLSGHTDFFQRMDGSGDGTYRRDHWLRFRAGGTPQGYAGVMLSHYDSRNTRIRQSGDNLVFETSIDPTGTFTEKMNLGYSSGTLTIAGVLTSSGTGNSDFSGSVRIRSDSGRLYLGSASVASIYHNGTNYFLTSNSGSTYIDCKNHLYLRTGGSTVGFHVDSTQNSRAYGNLTIDGNISSVASISATSLSTTGNVSASGKFHGSGVNRVVLPIQTHNGTQDGGSGFTGISLVSNQYAQGGFVVPKTGTISIGVWTQSTTTGTISYAIAYLIANTATSYTSWTATKTGSLPSVSNGSVNYHSMYTGISVTENQYLGIRWQITGSTARSILCFYVTYTA